MVHWVVVVAGFAVGFAFGAYAVFWLQRRAERISLLERAIRKAIAWVSPGGPLWR